MGISDGTAEYGGSSGGHLSGIYAHNARQKKYQNELDIERAGRAGISLNEYKKRQAERNKIPTRTAQQAQSSLSTNPFKVLSAEEQMNSRLSSAKSEAEGIDKLADEMAGPAQYAERAGEAIEDVDNQFAGQERARQVRQSRMGLDPSQTASVTGGRQASIAQAVARAGAMQSARREAEATQAQAKQSAFQNIGNIMSQNKEMEQQSRMQSQQNINEISRNVMQRNMQAMQPIRVMRG